MKKYLHGFCIPLVIFLNACAVAPEVRQAPATNVVIDDINKPRAPIAKAQPKATAKTAPAPAVKSEPTLGVVKPRATIKPQALPETGAGINAELPPGEQPPLDTTPADPAFQSDVFSPEQPEQPAVRHAMDIKIDKSYVAIIDQKQQYIAPRSPVATLFDTAGQQQKQGDYQAAASTLERALRIAPRNSLLWHQLAVVRYLQGELAQALQLAAKSNSFAGSDTQLQSKNWRVIGHIKDKQGDREGAQAAFAKAEKLIL